MISEHSCGVDTWQAVSIVGDPGGRKAAALGDRLAWTPCHYGGRRPWLVCPRCGRRCAKLYPLVHKGCLTDGRCRLCLRLGYWSRRVSLYGRRVHAAERIRERLGGAPDLSRTFPRRPKGMHRATYARLRREARALEADARTIEQLRRCRRIEREWAPLFRLAARLRARYPSWAPPPAAIC